MSTVMAGAVMAGAGAVSAKTIALSGWTLSISEPPGYCSLDANNPMEAMTIGLVEQGQNGINEVLAYWVSCPALDLLRRGEALSLTPYVLVLAPLEEGAVKALPSGMTRSSFLEVAQEGLSKEFADSNAHNVDQLIRKRFDESYGTLNDLMGSDLALGETRFLGPVVKDEIAVYFNMLQRYSLDGVDGLTAGSSAMTTIRNVSLNIIVYDDYTGEATLDRLHQEASSIARGIVVENGDLEQSETLALVERIAGGLNWGEALGKGLAAGILVAVLTGIAALFRFVLRWLKR